MAELAHALVLTAPEALEARDIRLPEIGDDDGLLRVEVAGICGTDVQQWRGRLGGIGSITPVIPGHEIVGRVERAGEAALRRWGVALGDRVVVEEVIRCGACPRCLSGDRGCDRLRVYGLTISVAEPPGLWGGYATYLYLAATAQLHRVPEQVSARDASLALPIANGIRWAAVLPQTAPGSVVAVLGPGQQGLGCVIGATEAGAGTIVVTGRTRDAHRLDVAQALGAHRTVDVDAEDPVAVVRSITGGRGADVVVDVTAEAPTAVTQAVDMCRSGGTVVLAGLKNFAPIPGFVSDHVVLKTLRILGAGGHDTAAVAAALDVIASGRYPLSRLHSHALPLDEAELALRITAREVPGEEPVHVALLP